MTPARHLLTCYLVRDRGDNWHIAYAGAIEDTRNPIGDISAPDIPMSDAPLRLAWFDRETQGLICFDSDEPDVQRLPE